MKKRRRIIIILTALLFVFFLLIVPIVSLLIYNTVFGVRYQTDDASMRRVEEFPGLIMDRYEFQSNKGQVIAAYFYHREGMNAKGVVIMAHGIGGGGHNPYMESANCFTENGYYVFAFDATGNDNSEGKSVKGLPQGVIDLDNAISYVEKSALFEGLPILLFGHSWGGYCVTSVLNEHPEVAAVCSVSGFNRSSDLLEAQGRDMIGPAINLMIGYLKIYEKITFGKYATQTGMDGFEKSDASVMIVHSEDDTTVPIQYGYDIYHEKYS
ncbi:MAG: alpha/beta fold hydrolase, partial [Lachnospiraceae bacterium]|nr:alpha/beta fold hydrolase [Lachnospiraceae bacterium]